MIAGLTESVVYHANDPYLIRLNSRGHTLWTKVFNSSGNNWVESMVPAPDKGAVMLGWDGTSAARGYDTLRMRVDSS
ncbi:MAG: hypothetical protein NT002_13245 [candidate division Zixibacteria bacterium]|nr:hypothetical protein [candidate division Zixibacteria bacterium]